MTEEKNVNITYSSINSCSSRNLSSFEIKENRKIMMKLLKNLNSIKTSPYLEIKSHCLEYLKKCDKEITKLIDEDYNTCY